MGAWRTNRVIRPQVLRPTTQLGRPATSNWPASCSGCSVTAGKSSTSDQRQFLVCSPSPSSTSRYAFLRTRRFTTTSRLSQPSAGPTSPRCPHTRHCFNSTTSAPDAPSLTCSRPIAGPPRLNASFPPGYGLTPRTETRTPVSSEHSEAAVFGATTTRERRPPSCSTSPPKQGPYQRKSQPARKSPIASQALKQRPGVGPRVRNGPALAGYGAEAIRVAITTQPLLTRTVA